MNGAPHKNAIEADSLTKRYGATTVLDGLTFAVAAGEKVALTGANGAGKTTLLAVLSTLAVASGGTATVAGHAIAEASEELRRKIGVLTHRPMVYEELSPLENLQFFARLYGVPAAAGRIEELLRMVGLWRRRDDLTRVLSRGMHQRLAIARAVVHAPQVLLLDEPETGLDAAGLSMLDDLMLGAPGVTVLAATHLLERVDRWAAARIHLERGSIVSSAGVVVGTWAQ